MPKIHIQRPHSLELPDAKARVQTLVAEVQSQFPNLVSSIRWSGDGQSARVDGKMFDGTFEVDERQIDVRLNISFLASPFRARIEGHIQSALDQRFGQA
jgi:putative polyhydroxyalkanoate system protein